MKLFESLIVEVATNVNQKTFPSPLFIKPLPEPTYLTHWGQIIHEVV